MDNTDFNQSQFFEQDKLDLKKIDGVSFLKMDIFDKTALRELNRFFGNKKIDLILEKNARPLRIDMH